MKIEIAKDLSIDELRIAFRSYLQSCNYAKNTIQTASNDVFYLWKNGSKELFWTIITSLDFEKKAREALIQALNKNSKGDPNKLVNGYLSHLRRFIGFLKQEDNNTQYKSLSRDTLKTSTSGKTEAIPAPTKEQVEYYLQQWNELDNYHLQEDALDKLFFVLCPENTNISDILIKVATLNDFYSTNIFSVYSVAKHILALNIDKRLKDGDVTLISELQKITINGAEKNFYSFATKYCSHHNPIDYPIYDSYVEKVLIYFKKRDNFSKFENREMKNYIRFKETLIDFRNFYGLDQFNLKQIDKYIWQLGKKHFPKNYGNGRREH